MPIAAFSERGSFAIMSTAPRIESTESAVTIILFTISRNSTDGHILIILLAVRSKVELSTSRKT